MTKKLTLAYLTLILAAFTLPTKAATVTETETFNTVGSGCGTYSLDPAGLPDGWIFMTANGSAWTKSNGGWPTNQGVDKTACLKFMSYSTPVYLLKYVQAGSVSFDIKPYSTSYTNKDVALVAASTTDGTTFSFGEEIKSVNFATDNLPSSEFSTITVENVPEGWVALRVTYCFLDNFSNTYEAVTYDINGTVLDSEGNPCEGATVSIAGLSSTTTDAEGKYSLIDIPGKEYTLSIEASGFFPYTATITPSEDNTTFDARLEQLRSTLICVPTSTQTEVNATFSLYEGRANTPSGEPILTGITADENGQYVFTVVGTLNPNGYTIKCDDFNKYYKFYNTYNTIQVYSNSTATNSFVDGQEKTYSLNYWFTPIQVSLTATVTDSEGNALSSTDCSLALQKPDGTSTALSYNSSNNQFSSGTFYAKDVADEECPIILTLSDDYAGLTVDGPESVVFDGANQTVNYILYSHIVTGTVINEWDTLIEGATATLYLGDSQKGQAHVTAADGRYTIRFTHTDTANVATYADDEEAETSSGYTLKLTHGNLYKPVTIALPALTSNLIDLGQTFMETDLMTGIESAEAESAVSVSAAGGDIIIRGNYESAEAYTLSGARTPLTSLPAGIYIVRVDGKAHKVAIR